MARVTVSNKGQITIPKEIRKRLGIKPGIQVECYIDYQGNLTIVPLTGTLKDLIGLLPRPDRALTIEEINEGIAEGAVEAAMRGL